jgi:urease subunit alpha
MGDSAASLMTCEPLALRPQWGAFGRAKQALSACFVNPLAIGADIAGKLDLSKAMLPAAGTRKLNKRHMLHNDACPKITVNPQTFDVFVDGALATCEPATRLPLAQRYMLR